MVFLCLKRQDVTPEYLHKCVSNQNSKVRQAVASNEKLDLEDLERLLDDLIDDVVVAAISNPSITKKLFSKLLTKVDFISYNVLIACLNTGNVTDNKIKKIFDKYRTSDFYMEEEEELVVELAIEAIKSKKISKETARYIIERMEGSERKEDILSALVINHPDFEDTVHFFCINDSKYKFFYNNASCIQSLSERNLNILWCCFKKDLKKGVISEQQKEALFLGFAKNNHISDKFVKDLICFVQKNYTNNSLKELLLELTANKNLPSESIKYVWRLCNSKFRMECKDIYNQKFYRHNLWVSKIYCNIREHPNLPKEFGDIK